MVCFVVRFAFLSILCMNFFTDSTLYAASNTWSKVAGNGQLGAWDRPALVYSPNTDEFILTVGAQTRSTAPYTVQSFPRALGNGLTLCQVILCTVPLQFRIVLIRLRGNGRILPALPMPLAVRKPGDGRGNL